MLSLFLNNFLFALMRISEIVSYKIELQKDKSLGYRKSEDRQVFAFMSECILYFG